jgi:hypothetical protein
MSLCDSTVDDDISTVTFCSPTVLGTRGKLDSSTIEICDRSGECATAAAGNGETISGLEDSVEVTTLEDVTSIST